MIGEKSPLIHERAVDRPLLPQILAKKFIEGKLLEGAAVVYEGDKSITYRCFEANEALPGFDQAALRLDYRVYHEAEQKRHDQLRFEYTVPSESDPSDRRCIAEMHLAVVSPKEFILEHRYVRPDVRRRHGLGPRLLTVVESWVGQVAHESGQSAHISLQAGQKNVIDWIQKMGYRVRQNQAKDLQELVDYPERFIEDRVILSEESQAQGTVKDPYMFRKDQPGRYMEDAVRITFEKEIPHQ